MNFERIMKDTNTCLMGFFAFLLLLIMYVHTVQSRFSDILFSDKSRLSDNFAEDHFSST